MATSPVATPGSSPESFGLSCGLVSQRRPADALETEIEAEVRARAEAYGPQQTAYAEGVAAALELHTPPRFELWFLDADRIVPL